MASGVNIEFRALQVTARAPSLGAVHGLSCACTDQGAAPAAEAESAGPWPSWALPQLRQAAGLARRLQARGYRGSLAAELYRSWFNPIVSPVPQGALLRSPLAGVYRTAHAGSATRTAFGDVTVVDRHDVVGRDGWWRTWGPAWRPAQSRRDCVRVHMTPRPSALAELIAVLTGALLNEPQPWLLACATDPRRVRRGGGVVLHIPLGAAMCAGLHRRLRPLLVPTLPPLCLPVAPGLAIADDPGNGMSFGEHRCHLVSLGLGTDRAQRAPLRSLAVVFAAHGIDPGRPHLSRAAPG